MRAQAILFLLLIGVAVYSVESAPIGKRFLFKSILKALENAFDLLKDKLGDFSLTINTFVAQLDTLITSEDSQAKCEQICVEKIAALIHIKEDAARELCPIGCDIALDKLHQVTKHG